MYKKTLIIIIIFVFQYTLFAQSDKPRMSISFDSGYLENSNRAMRNFSLEYTKLITYLDYEHARNWSLGNSTLAYGITYFLYGFLLMPVNLTFHEYGHASRGMAFGQDVEYHFFLNEENAYPNRWVYFPNALLDGWSGGYVMISGRLHENTPEVFVDNTNRDILISSGGLNNQMSLAEAIEDDIYYNKGYRGYFWAHLQNKLSTLFYILSEGSLTEGGDPTAIEADYELKGYNIDKNIMSLTNIGAVLLSASSYKLLFSYTGSSSGVVESYEFHGFRLPDTQFYMMHKGITYKVNSCYAIRKMDLYIPFSYEKVIIGGHTDEPSAGIMYDNEKYFATVKGLYNVQSSATGGEVTGGARFNYIGCTAGLNLYNGETLSGARDIPTFKNGTNDYELWGRISFLF